MIEQNWLEWLTSGEKLLGLIVMVIGIIGGGISWFWRRVSRQVKAGVFGVETGQAAIIARLDEVERDVGGFRGELENVKERVAEVEKGISSLATSKELAVLDRHLAMLTEKADAQGTMLRMFYEAALRSDPGGRKS